MQILDIKAQIQQYETVGESTIFYIFTVTDQSTMRTKTNKLRYSQFRDYHQEISQLIKQNKIDVSLPQFPSRKLFSSTNKSEQAILQRMRDLEEYLNQLLGIDKIRQFQVVQMLLPDQSKILMRNNEKIYMKAMINQYALIDENVYYYIKIRDLCHLEDWAFRARYSQLRQVHQILSQNSIKNMPEFPKKKYLSSTNHNPDAIQIRRLSLEKYLNLFFDVLGISPKNIFQRKKILKYALEQKNVILTIQKISVIKIVENIKKQSWRSSKNRNSWRNSQNESINIPEMKTKYSIRKIQDILPQSFQKKLANQSYNNILDQNFTSQEFFDMESQFLDLPENWDSYDFQIQQNSIQLCEDQQRKSLTLLEQISQRQSKNFYEKGQKQQIGKGQQQFGQKQEDIMGKQDIDIQSAQEKAQQPQSQIVYKSEQQINKKQMHFIKPVNLQSEITQQYIDLILQKQNQKYYLKSYFANQLDQPIDQSVPWYDPTLFLTSKTQFIISEDKELIFINEQLMKKQKDSVKFIMKEIGANFMSGKSLLSVSLPVQIFQPRSLLQRSASEFGCAPKYLKPVAIQDSLTQIKALVGFMVSVFSLGLCMEKPFNPILGQTFSAFIGGVPIYYQQISHHPPISAYFMQCEQFTLHGNIVAIANASLNSGEGGNAGKMYIKMKNGNQFMLTFPSVKIGGLIYGKRKISLFNKGFIINQKQNIIAQISSIKQSKGLYERKKGQKQTKGDIIGGIFKVTQKFIKKICQQQSLMGHSGIKKSDMLEKISHIEGIWFQKVYIDDKIVNDKGVAYPLQYTSVSLPSDANFRMDILTHRMGNLNWSQEEKTELQDLQRKQRNLRQKLKKNK